MRTVQLPPHSAKESIPAPVPPTVVVQKTLLLPAYSPAEPPETDTAFARSPMAVPVSSAMAISDNIIREYTSKYEAIFQEAEDHRENVFAADMKLYDTGFDQVTKNVQDDPSSSRQALFRVTNEAFQAIFSDDQERYSKIVMEKAYLQETKDSLRESHYSASHQTLLVLFDEDKKCVLKEFSLSDGAEWQHLSMLVDSIQKLFLMYKGWRDSMLRKHDNIFSAAMEEYGRRLGIVSNTGAPIPYDLAKADRCAEECRYEATHAVSVDLCSTLSAYSALRIKVAANASTGSI